MHFCVHVRVYVCARLCLGVVGMRTYGSVFPEIPTKTLQYSRHKSPRSLEHTGGVCTFLLVCLFLVCVYTRFFPQPCLSFRFNSGSFFSLVSAVHALDTRASVSFNRNRCRVGTRISLVRPHLVSPRHVCARSKGANQIARHRLPETADRKSTRLNSSHL